MVIVGFFALYIKFLKNVEFVGAGIPESKVGLLTKELPFVNGIISYASDVK